MNGRVVTIGIVVAFAVSACGGGSGRPPRPDLADANDVAETEGLVPDGAVEPGPDGEVPPTPDTPAESGVEADELGLDEGPDGETSPTDAEAGPEAPPEVEEAEEEVQQNECPCNETVVAQVCADDGTAFGQTFVNDQCAKCAICKDGPNCKGCTGQKECGVDPEDPDTGWVLYRAECGKCAQACADGPFCKNCLSMPDGCQFDKLCAKDPVDQGKSVNFDGVCELIQAYGCKVADFRTCDWVDIVVSFGECLALPCAGCPAAMNDPVCFGDGGWEKTFDSYCAAQKCKDPEHPDATFKHGGRCLSDCPACAAVAVSEVCGADTTTYANACAATTCGGTTVAWEGMCCPNCEDDPIAPVCAPDGTKFDNECFATCRGYETCGDTGLVVCGLDGKDYPNECQANCFAGGKLHDGECQGYCEHCDKTLAPVCDAATGKSYANKCFAECHGAGTTVDGICSGCETICGPIDNPKEPGEVCADGVTYPSACFPQKCFLPSSTPGPCA